MSDFTRPGASLAAVTKSDTADIATLNGLYPRAIWVGTAGDVVLVTPDGKFETLKNVANGTLIPIQTRRVNAATDAADIVAIY